MNCSFFHFEHDQPLNPEYHTNDPRKKLKVRMGMNASLVLGNTGLTQYLCRCWAEALCWADQERKLILHLSKKVVIIQGDVMKLWWNHVIGRSQIVVFGTQTNHKYAGQCSALLISNVDLHKFPFGYFKHFFQQFCDIQQLSCKGLTVILCLWYHMSKKIMCI